MIIATSFGDSERLLQAIEAGVDRYVLKPIQARAVLDVLQAVAVQARVRLEHRLAASVFRNASEAILITDGDNRIVDANPAFTRITGYSRDEVLGANPRLLHSGNQSADFYREMWAALNGDSHWRGEIWNRRKNGELYPEWLSIDRVCDDDGKVINYIAMWSDISERKEAEARINYLAHYDVLTDLPNRVLFADRFQQALVHARRTDQNVALLFLDLDRFKRVNDSLGHRAGDQLLQTIAARLKECVREDDTVSRRGGDEFVILLSGLSRPQQAGAVASKILSALARPVLCEGQEISVSASIGIACYPQDGQDGESLVVNADLAMYRAKQLGRDNYQYFSADLETGTENRLQLEVDMRHGLERGEFELFYLPQLDNVTGHGGDRVADLGPDGIHQTGDFPRGLGGALRQLAHLVRHHGKAPALFPGPGCLDGGVQGEQIGLVRNILNHLDNAADFVRVLLQDRDLLTGLADEQGNAVNVLYRPAHGSLVTKGPGGGNAP